MADRFRSNQSWLSDLYAAAVALLIGNTGLIFSAVQLSSSSAAESPALLGRGAMAAAGAAMFLLVKGAPAFVLAGIFLEHLRAGRVKAYRLLTVVSQFCLWMSVCLPQALASSPGVSGLDVSMPLDMSDRALLRELLLFVLTGCGYSYLWLVTGSVLYRSLSNPRHTGLLVLDSFVRSPCERLSGTHQVPRSFDEIFGIDDIPPDAGVTPVPEEAGELQDVPEKRSASAQS